MPKTAMDKYNCLISSEDKVGFAGKPSVVQPISKAHPVDESSKS